MIQYTRMGALLLIAMAVWFGAVSAVQAHAGLELTKTLHTEGPLFAGDQVIWNITLKNTGGTAVTGITVTEKPSGLGEFSLVKFEASDGTTYMNNVWTIDSLAGNGASATLNLTMTIAEAGKKKNCVEITSPAQAGTHTAGSEVCASATILSPLVLTKTLHTEGPIFAGDQVIWNITLKNNGGSAVTDIKVTENPSGLGDFTLDKVEASDGTTFANNEWIIGSITGGTSATLNLTMTIAEAGKKKNCVEITSQAGTHTAGSEVCASATIMGPCTTGEITIKPETLNLRSRGLFTVFIRLCGDYPRSEINLEESSLICNGAKPKNLKVSQKGGGTVIAKFRRQDLDENVVAGEKVEITCEGIISVGGESVKVKGSDTIRVIGERKKGFDRFWCDILDTILPTTEDDGENQVGDQTPTATPTPGPQVSLNHGQLKKAERGDDSACTGDCSVSDSQGSHGNGKKAGKNDEDTVTGSDEQSNQGNGNGQGNAANIGKGNGKGNSNKPDNENGNGKNKK
jgi:hypothetical protein